MSESVARKNRLAAIAAAGTTAELVLVRSVNERDEFRAAVQAKATQAA